VTAALDDAEAIGRLDASNMLGTVGELPTQCRKGYEVGRAAGSLPVLDGVTSVVFCGMGGSAVAGDVLRAAFRHRLGVPVDVNRSAQLPAYATTHTLVVVSSYSGETAETLAAFREAEERGCRIVAITSGGTLADACRSAGHGLVEVPAGFQPRAALGHLAFGALGALEAGGLLPRLGDDVDEVVAELSTLPDELGPSVSAETNPAKAIAAWLGDRVPVIWGAEGIGSVAAMRWKTQMNENGKVPAWSSSMSELDHNEVVGWVPPYGGSHAVIALRHEGEGGDLAARFTLSAAIAADAGAAIREVGARGSSPLARLLTLILFGDFASCYVGLAHGHDPTPVDVIVRLKAALGG
jgi:glucose/mannose-6-phosphate isomerase